MRKNDQETLKQRAGMISGLRKKKEEPSASVWIVEFELGPERYGIEYSYLSEVLSFRKITRIPGTPDFVAGLINLRGKVYSIVNLKIFFHKDEQGISPTNKMIILKHQNMEFGILVDSIREMKQLDLNALSSPPPTIPRSGAKYISGISPDGIILLDMLSILTDDAIIVNQK